MALIFGRKKKEEPQFSEFGQDSHFEGEINSKNLLIINGVVKGILKGEKSIETGDKSQIDARMVCSNAIIKGGFKGDIDAEYVLIGGTARVEGQIKTKKIKIEKGAVFNGRIL